MTVYIHPKGKKHLMVCTDPIKDFETDPVGQEIRGILKKEFGLDIQEAEIIEHEGYTYIFNK